MALCLVAGQDPKDPRSSEGYGAVQGFIKQTLQVWMSRMCLAQQRATFAGAPRTTEKLSVGSGDIGHHWPQSAFGNVEHRGTQLAQGVGIDLGTLVPRFQPQISLHFALSSRALFCSPRHAEIARCMQSEIAEKTLRRFSKEQLCPLPWRRGSCKLHFQNVTNSEETVYVANFRFLFNVETFGTSSCQSTTGVKTCKDSESAKVA